MGLEEHLRRMNKAHEEVTLLAIKVKKYADLSLMYADEAVKVAEETKEMAALLTKEHDERR